MKSMPVVERRKYMPLQTKFIINKKSKKSNNNLIYFKNNFYLYLLIIIPITFYLVFSYLPMVGLVISFKDYNMFQGLFSGKWVGLDVFKEVFKMKDFWSAVKNTFTLNIISLLVSFPCPIILAIMLNELKKVFAKRVFQSVVYLPYFISWMLIGGMAIQILSQNYGYVNHFIKLMGLPPIPFLTNNVWWVVTFVGTLVWQSTGYNSIIYLAAITGINPELYEAAKMDGCTRIGLVRHVTLPCIKPTIVIMFILAVGNIMNIGFDRVYALQNPIVMDVADTIATYVFRTGIQNARYSVATAVGLFQSIVALVMISMANYITKKLGEEGIW